MANPSLDVGNWVGILGLAGGAIAAVTAMIRRYVTSVTRRIDSVEEDMKEWDMLHAEHNTQLAVVKNCQENTKATLDELKETASKVNDKLDAVLLALTKTDH